MQELSITQKFMLCVMNDKGRISGLDTDKFVCLVASGLLELYYENFITLEKKKVQVIKELPAEKFYLKPLYDFLDQPSPVKLERIVEEYTLSDKKIREFTHSLGQSLAEKEMVIVSAAGYMGKKQVYLPKKEKVYTIIDEIRKELLLCDNKITGDAVCLTLLLDKSRMIKRYFSSYEQKEIRYKLKKLTDSETNILIKNMMDYLEELFVMMMMPMFQTFLS